MYVLMTRKLRIWRVVPHNSLMRDTVRGQPLLKTAHLYFQLRQKTTYLLQRRILGWMHRRKAVQHRPSIWCSRTPTIFLSIVFTVEVRWVIRLKMGIRVSRFYSWCRFLLVGCLFFTIFSHNVSASLTLQDVKSTKRLKLILSYLLSGSMKEIYVFKGNYWFMCKAVTVAVNLSLLQLPWGKDRKMGLKGVDWWVEKQ